MPFIDFAANSASESNKYDAIVIGCGAAGIFLATQLSKQNKSVAVVETGGFREEDRYQALNSIEQSSKRQSDPLWNRKRVIGGTTTAWGGQSLPFHEIDFSFRPWIPAEWPLTHRDLEKHYIKANRFMNVDGMNYDTDVMARTGIRDPGFSKDLIYFHFSKWAPQPNFIKLKRQDLSTHCDIYFNAHCIGLNWQSRGVVDGVQIASTDGKKGLLQGKAVFLAAGGIETVRFLLLSQLKSRLRHLAPLQHLGVGFMDHPCMTVGRVHACSREDIFRLHQKFATRRCGRDRYTARMSASPTWQTNAEMANISAGFVFMPDPSRDWIDCIRKLSRNPSAASLTSALRQLPRIVEGLWILARHGLIYRRWASPRLAVMCEQPASTSSYITLASETDSFGQQRARLNWTVDPLVAETIRSFSQIVCRELERLNICKVELLPEVSATNEELLQSTTDVNHHMGGARMSRHPSTGVVDQWLRVWGSDNLFVCSAAVFPSSSHSNPTLTLLALVSRLIDRLKCIDDFATLNDNL